MNEEVFSAYAALSELNRRVNQLEGNMPDYIADMFQMQKEIGLLTSRVMELERKLETITKV